MIKPGFYKHYKGNVYVVMGLARHTETEELMVIYSSVDAEPGDPPWARPASMWNEEIEWPDGVKRARFVEI